MRKHLYYLFRPLLLTLVLIGGLSTVQADCKYNRSISAEEIAVGVLLNWSTCQEKDNSMFIVEKSTDGQHFVNLGAIKGAGQSTSSKEYSFLDISPGAERVFYRLRQINFSGTYSFSDVLTVNKKGSNHFIVTRMSAVAAEDFFEVSVDARIEGNMTYSLLDWKGNILNTEEMPLFTGMNKVSIDLEGLPAAIYRLE